MATPINPWTNDTPFEPGTLIRASAMNEKLDGIAVTLGELSAVSNNSVIKTPDDFTGNTQLATSGSYTEKFVYVNSSGDFDWLPKTYFDDQVALAQGYASSASTSATASANSATASASSATASSNSATLSGQYANAAEDVIVTAGNYSSYHWSRKSFAWSETAEDVEVQPGLYSAKHWSQKAYAWSETAEDTQVKPGEYSAYHWSRKAYAWSETPENVEVQPGLYSAKHWAKVSQQYAQTSVGAIIFSGYFDASNGTYPVTDDQNRLWKITVAGTLGGVDYEVGDSLVYYYDRDEFFKVDSTDKVMSVNGYQGAVVLTANDVGAVPSASVTSYSLTLLGKADASNWRTTLGLGSAATRNVGTGAGDVPEYIGDFGVAGLGYAKNNVTVSTPAAEAALDKTQFYKVGSAANTVFSQAATVLHMNYQPDIAAQFALPVGGHPAQWRSKIGGTWSAVRTFWDNNNLARPAKLDTAQTFSAVNTFYGDGENVILKSPDTGVAVKSYMSIHDNNDTRIGYVGVGSNSNNRMTLRSDDATDGGITFTCAVDGYDAIRFDNRSYFTDSVTIAAQQSSNAKLGLGTTNGIERLTVVPLSGSTIAARFQNLTDGSDIITRYQASDAVGAVRYADIRLDPDEITLNIMAPRSTTPTIDAIKINSSGDITSTRDLSVNRDLSVTGAISATDTLKLSTGGIKYVGGAISFLEGGSASLPINTNNLLVSDSYSDRTNVPTNGMYVKGGITTIGTMNVAAINHSGNTNYTSDAKYKTRIATVKPDYRAIDNLRLVHFEWLRDYHDKELAGKEDWGIIAQEVQSWFPQFVKEITRKVDGKEQRYLAVDKVSLLLYVTLANNSRPLHSRIARDVKIYWRLLRRVLPW